MDDNKAKEMQQQFSRLLRTAYKPLVEETEGNIFDSKFSGTPYLADGEAWPVCGSCGNFLHHFLQLNLEQLPDELKGRYGEQGLLQLFYCVECDDWEPFSIAMLVRIVHPNENVEHEIHVPELKPIFPPKIITSWQSFEEYPDIIECEDLKWMTLNETEKAALEFFTESYDNADEWESPELGDKLAGWPHWIQGVEYPECPICKQPMKLVFQLDSEDNLPFMFGDVGCGHITQCREHKEQLAFSWACF